MYLLDANSNLSAPYELSPTDGGSLVLRVAQQAYDALTVEAADRGSFHRDSEAELIWTQPDLRGNWVGDYDSKFSTKIRIGRLTEERRNGFQFFDSASALLLERKGISFSEEGLPRAPFAELDRGFQLSPGIAERLLDRRRPVTIHREHPDGTKSSVAGTIFGIGDPSSSAGYRIEFRSSRRHRLGPKAKLLTMIQRFLKSQHRANRYAKIYLDSPEPEPMARELFVALFAELAAVYPRIVESPTMQRDLLEVLGGRGEPFPLLKLREPDHLGLTLSLPLRRCTHCGRLKGAGRIQLYDHALKEARYLDSPRPSRVLEDAHSGSKCRVFSGTSGPKRTES